jgi:hypothetical protein
MKTFSVRCLGIALVLALLLIGPTTSAQQGDYSLAWVTVVGGGTSSGGVYTVAATVGQPEVSAAMSGGNYTLAGGVWGSPIAPRPVYLPLVLRQ